MKPITDPRIVDSAWQAFVQVFDNGWTESHPRSLPKSARAGEERLLYPQGYELDEEVFAAVRAAAAVYDEPHLYLNLTEYNPDKPQLWLVEWSEGPEFPLPRHVIRLENAIFSPGGNWGVWLTQTDIAVVAGDERFLRDLERGLPRSYLDQFELLTEEGVDSRGRPDDYLLELLSRTYGWEEAERRIRAVVASRQAPEV